MAATIQRIESNVTYPDAPTGLSARAAALDPNAIWARIESYIAWRWTARDVLFVIEGPGDWRPNLAPATVSAVELWQDEAWLAVTLSPSAIGGYVLDGKGPYRITASVGSGTVPADAQEAFRRLAEYMAGAENEFSPSYSSLSLSGLGGTQKAFERPAAHAAKALQYSGAGDLLRPYRRAP
ncbi:MAG: hypothetical protein SWN98_04410 [Pseudomonadota bacterium]|jgi:hypothetical protein|nr:hypothetical protein JT55_10485 [Rhodovulum sp. NI22]MDY6858563.1 hypothetical protein [Pseudomonadota bacterium]